MWNRDKHRLLNLASIRINAVKVSYLYSDRFGVPKIEEFLGDATTATEDGAEVYRFVPPGDITPKVKVVEQMDYSGPLFKDAGPATGLDVRELLTKLVNLTEGIIDELIATVR